MKRQAAPQLDWYSSAFYPDSPEGYVYLIEIIPPYSRGTRKVRVGGHYERDADGKKRLVGGVTQERPQWCGRYLGWSPSPWRRFDQHRRGYGTRLLKHLAEIGHHFELVYVCPGGRDLEARLKRLHNNNLIGPHISLFRVGCHGET